jgi:hypothetical protein
MIAVAVRWYLRYGLSYRDVEELLAERGIVVDHVTVLLARRPTQEGISLFNPATITVTRYRYRDPRIPLPWTATIIAA